MGIQYMGFSAQFPAKKGCANRLFYKNALLLVHVIEGREWGVGCVDVGSTCGAPETFARNHSEILQNKGIRASGLKIRAPKKLRSNDDRSNAPFSALFSLFFQGLSVSEGWILLNAWSGGGQFSDLRVQGFLRDF